MSQLNGYDRELYPFHIILENTDGCKNRIIQSHCAAKAKA